jgi:hypothetical protein
LWKTDKTPLYFVHTANLLPLPEIEGISKLTRIMINWYKCTVDFL